MDNTGMVTRPLVAEARAILFAAQNERQLRHTLGLLAEIDRAHLVMLGEEGVLKRQVIKSILLGIEELARSRFEQVVTREPVRGIYMLYEHVLTERVPEARDAHIGRSRNDINATLFALRCRTVLAELISEVLHVLRSLEVSTARFGTVEMPVFSHRRPAMPGSWELYISGISAALQRDVASLFGAMYDLDRCALGAGAGAGTELPINAARTAQLLGFGTAVTNSLDAVASRDAGLRAVAAAAILTSNLSRFAGDLLIWFAEQDAIELPDELVGASSIMPQKRNAFILEHVLGKAGRVSGALSAALTACHGAPFSNAVQVATESVESILEGLSIAQQTARLMTLLMDGAKPVAQKFASLNKRGGAGATSLALSVRERHGLTFRAAHQRVGAALRAAASDEPVEEAAKALGLTAAWTDASKFESGGGAGRNGSTFRLSALGKRSRAYNAELQAFRDRWAAAECDLRSAIDRMTKGDDDA